ncbi:hypothetical protein C0989_004493 [Termitomyces sp. Mn162]|nr:hypothetical protein C0989_004493 [Termitomyces sp. Mn162]
MDDAGSMVSTLTKMSSFSKLGMTVKWALHGTIFKISTSNIVITALGFVPGFTLLLPEVKGCDPDFMLAKEMHEAGEQLPA